MIGSGTQDDPWVPISAAELNDAWTKKGGFIDLTTDIYMGDVQLGGAIASPMPILNLNGFRLIISKVTDGYDVIFNARSGSKVIKNGCVVISGGVNKQKLYVIYGGSYEQLEDILVINESLSVCAVKRTTNIKSIKCACINTNANYTESYGFTIVYQGDPNGLNGFFKVGNASSDQLLENGFNLKTWYVDSWLGGKNVRIEKTGVSFVAGVTLSNGIPKKMEVTVIGSSNGVTWSGVSNDNGEFNINVGSYQLPVSVFSSDVINKKLRAYMPYDSGDVAITDVGNGVKFTCTSSGVTDSIPDDLPSSGVVNLGSATFNVSNINHSACAGPMIPAKKHSTYGIKSK